MTQLLAAGPAIAAGIIGAYNPELRALDLRNNFSPLTTELLALLGVDFCLPVLQNCPVSGADRGGRPHPPPSPRPPTPISALLALLAAPGADR